MADPLRTILVLVAGLGTGVLSGMFGVGGAVVSTPAIRVLGATPLESIGSTLPSILPSAISGALRYRREGLLRLRVALWTAAFGTAASVEGALLVDEVPGNGHILMILTAALLGFTAGRMAVAPDRPDPADAEPPAGAPLAGEPDGLAGAPLAVESPTLVREEWWRCALTGLAAGLMSGLLGIGGGLVMVPAFASWMRLPIKEALGTSLVCVGLLAVPGTIAHQLLGHINWAYALPLCLSVIPGARLGAALAIRSSDRLLRLMVASVLGAIAVVYAGGELLSLVR